MKTETAPPVIPDKTRKRLENKLSRALAKSGITWTAWAEMVEIADVVAGIPNPTACWVYNNLTKRERVCVGTKVIKELPIHVLVLVLKHEFLHKTMYREIKGAANLELVNYVLDCCINKILWLATPIHARKLGDYLFPPNLTKDGKVDTNNKPAAYRCGVESLMNPGSTSFDRQHMPENLRAIFDEIWYVKAEDLTCCEDYGKHRVFANVYVPDPLLLYKKLASTLTRNQKKKIAKIYAHISAINGKPNPSDEKGNQGGPGGGGKEKSDDEEKGKGDKPGKPNAGDGDKRRGGAKRERSNDKGTLGFEKQIAEEIAKRIADNFKGSGRGGGFSLLTDLDSIFKKYLYHLKQAETAGISDFIRQWETMKQVDSAITDIYSEVRNSISVEPFPMNLSRLGQELVALDVSNEDMPLYFNLSSDGVGGKKKVCCYFDTSPSMDSFIPYMLHVVQFFDSCEDCIIDGGEYKGRYVFSEKVKGIPEDKWEDFKQGKLRGGYATSFEAVIVHAIERIEQDQVDIILVFTDGLSGVSSQTIERFAKSGKKCYTLYFTYGMGYDRQHSRNRSMNMGFVENEMASDLDKLPGKSFTIYCNVGED